MTVHEFQALFCKKHNCAFLEYDERAFRELLYWHARALAPVLRRVNPRLFSEDFKFIRYLGETTDLREAKANAADFQDANAARRNLLRTRLRIRVSGGKATRLAYQLFAIEDRPERKAS